MQFKSGKTMGAKAGWLGIVAILTFATSASAREMTSQLRPNANFLIANVRVFDGESIHENAQVAVEGGIVRAVGQRLTRWRRLPVIDGTGATLIPGLIDAHAHVRNIDDLQEAIRFGVTTVLDMGASGVTPQTQATLRNAATVRMDVADVRMAGYFATAPGGHGTEFRSAGVGPAPTVPTVEGVDAFVAARHAEGSDYLKIVLNGVRTADRGTPNLDEARVKALVAAAHSRGMLAVAHVETIGDVEIALASGVDVLAHVWRRGGANPDLARRIALKGVYVVPDLVIPDGLLPDGRAALLADSRLQPYISNRAKQQLSRSFIPAGQPNTDRRAILESHVEALKSLHAQGARILVGTDAAMSNPTMEHSNPTAHGISVHRELELLNAAGLSPTEVLTSATKHTADAFRLTDRGRIVVGRKADLVLVRGDPTTDITATRDILRVWRSGVELDRGPPQ
jgi:imidazolonepropionase-like amidohydrolase